MTHVEVAMPVSIMMTGMVTVSLVRHTSPQKEESIMKIILINIYRTEVYPKRYFNFMVAKLKSMVQANLCLLASRILTIASKLDS